MKRFKIKYEYVASYTFMNNSNNSGAGRIFVTLYDKIKSVKDFEELELYIKNLNGSNALFVTNLILLNSKWCLK